MTNFCTVQSGSDPLVISSKEFSFYKQVEKLFFPKNKLIEKCIINYLFTIKTKHIEKNTSFVLLFAALSPT